MPSNTPRLTWANRYWPTAVMIVVMLLTGFDIYDRHHYDRLDITNFPSNTPTTEVYAQTFANQTVDADGKKFNRCVFENVTFKYHGLAEWDMIEPTFKGNIIVDTNNVGIKQMMVMVNWMSHRPGVAALGVGIDDGHGNVQTLSWDLHPTPPQ